MRPLRPFDISFSGINLVEASAGTGKTYNITSLYIRALIELDLTVKQILVVTYTEAATKELKDRLLGRIRESIVALKTNSADEKDQFLNQLLEQVENRRQAVEKLEVAIRSFDEAAVYTIHGFCYQSLQEQAFESGAMYGAEMIGDDSELVLEAVDDYWRNWVAEVSEDPQKRPLLKLLTDRNLGPESLADQLGSYIGKPYLKVLAEQIDGKDPEAQLKRLWQLYDRFKTLWANERRRVWELLNTGDLSYYTENKLNKWFGLMDEFLKSELPPLDTFTQFYRFKQSRIDESLKKPAQKKGKRPPEHALFQTVDEYDETVAAVSQFEVIFKKRLLQYLKNELPGKKEELQVLSYDDLLLRLQEALQEERRGPLLADKLRQKYPLALVDEFQDTDPCQYDIFRRIYKQDDASCALFMIGDPKQSIYSFRGADVFSYIQAKKDADRDRLFNLKRNFRSTPELLEGINALFGRHSNPFILDDIPFEAVEAGKDSKDYKRLSENGEDRKPIRFRCLDVGREDPRNKSDGQEQAAADAADEIQRLIEDGKKKKICIGTKGVKAKDIAVLVRSHYQAGIMSDALRDRDIKSVQYSQESVFESDEARQLEILLKAVAEPSNESLVRSALSLPLIDFSAADLLEIEDNEQRWVEILQQFADWHKRWMEYGFSSMFRKMLREAKILRHVIQYPDGERRLTNLLHLGELLQREDQRRRGGSRGLLKWLARKRKDDSRRLDEEQLRLESDEALVKIVTMHRSKGLEYPIVFCPFLWHGPEFKDFGKPLVFHDPDDSETAYLDLNGKQFDERSRHRYLAEREELAESLRLAYVAITRAEQCCYLTWAYADKSEFSPLGYLFLGQERVFDLLKTTISAKYQSQGGTEIYEVIAKLCELRPELFTLQRDRKTKDWRDDDGDEESPTFDRRTFERAKPLRPTYHISSFSSLTSWMDENSNMPDYDQYLDHAYQEERVPKRERSMFTFPKGPQPGTCVHKIFEETDFSTLDNIDTTIGENLPKYGIDLKWQTVVSDMVWTVVTKPLLESDPELQLSALNSSDFIPELEFYYQNTTVQSRELLSIIREGEEDYPLLGGRAEAGFLKGFIDLTFRFGDKFYLLDYKSNFLGDSYEDYRQTNLEAEMLEATYDLQYHIYTVALHRFLKKRLTGYSYEQHFGGAFYLFLRGINKGGRQGIFFDRPEFAKIQKLNRYLIEGGSYG